MTEIYVLDTETTGLDGCPGDHVVDVGIARLDTDTGEVSSAFSSIVGYDVAEWDDNHRNAWIFRNTDLSLDQIENASSQSIVSTELTDILEGKNVTAYNTGFDFDKFLYKSPWSLRGVFHEYPDVMKAAAPVLKIPGYYGDYKWPKLEVAYGRLCPDDPAGIHGSQDHRALSDSIVASYVLKSLIDRDAYSIGD